MRKILLTLLMLIFLITFLISRPVSLEQANQVTRNWMLERTGLIIEPETIQLVRHAYEEQFYIFNIDPAGFIIISGNDAAPPVLGYNRQNHWDEGDIPPQLAAIIDNWSEQLTAIALNNYPADDATEALWQNYTQESEYFMPSRDFREVAPLVSSTWGQGTHYNAQTPDNTPVGCVAVAMGQIMHYWSHPTTGEGSHSYVHPTYGTLSADFGATTYQWANMPDYLIGPNDHIATLLYHLGVSVEMDYHPDGSGAYSEDVVPALTAYFKYSFNAQLVSKSAYTTTAWNNLLISELESARPMYYGGVDNVYGGHAFVLDGYQGTNHFHFNWGWNGSYNGYYYLTALNPGTYDFTSNQRAIVGIQPAASVSEIFFEGFDGTTFPPTGWTRTQLATGPPANNWTRDTPGAANSAGTAYHEYDPQRNPDSWLVSPAIPLPADAIIYLYFQEKNDWVPAYYGYSGVLISSGSSAAGSPDFVEIYESDTAKASWTQTAIQIPSSYAGETVYLAFNYQGQDAHDWWVDEVTVVEILADLHNLTMLDPVGSGTVIPIPGVHEYIDNEIVNLIAKPALGFFDYWERDGALYSTNRVTSVTMDSHYETQAFFYLPAGALAQGFDYGNPVPTNWEETNIDNAWEYGDDSFFFSMFDGYALIGQVLGNAEEMLISPTLQLDGSVNTFAYWVAGGNNGHGLGSSVVQLRYKEVSSPTWTDLGPHLDLADADNDQIPQYITHDLSAIPYGDYKFAFAVSSTFNYETFRSWLGIDNVVGPVRSGTGNNDLEVSIVSYPNSIIFEGQTAVLSAEIKNVGILPQTGTQVTFTIDDGVTAPLTANIGTLAYNETEIVTVDYTAVAGRHTITASLPDDDDNDNNEATTQGVIAGIGHLAEGFEDDIPTWQKDPEWIFWVSDWLPAYEGNRAIAAGSTAGFAESYLITPVVSIEADSELNFYASFGNASVGPADLDIIYSVDGETWIDIETGIIPTSAMQLYTIDLSGITPGDYYLGFRASGSGDGTYATWIAVDHVIGPFMGAPGIITGTVTLVEASRNITDVVISAAGETTNPEPDGTYSLDVPPGNHSVTASLFGYQTETITNVFVASGATVTGIDFALGKIEIAVNPLSFNEALTNTAGVVSYPLEISNPGLGELEYNIYYSDPAVRAFTPEPNNRRALKSSVRKHQPEKSHVPDRTSTGNISLSGGEFSLRNEHGLSLSPRQIPGGEPETGGTRQQVILHYDGPNDGAIAAGGTPMYVAARFPVTPYAALDLTSVDVYINDMTSYAELIVWGEGTTTTPGTIIHQQVFTPVPHSWNTIVLAETLPLDGNDDIWIGYYGEYIEGNFPFGSDAGPAHIDGAWTSFDGVAWDRLYEIAPTLDYNWNIRGLVERIFPWLSVDQREGSVLAGNTDIVNMLLDPSGMAEGVYNANIVIANNAILDPVTVPVELTVIAGDPTLGITPSSWDYGDVELMNPSPKIFVLRNLAGDGTVTINNIYIDGTNPDDFVLDAPAPPFNIIDDATVDVTVTFLPQTEGAKSAYLHIHVDGEAFPRNYALSGNCIPEEIGQPVGLTADIINYTNVLLEWGLSYGAFEGWLYWHNGTPAYVLQGPDQWDAAIKFGIADLGGYEGAGFELTEVVFIPNHSDPAVDEPTYSVKVWTGNDADLGPSTLLVEQLIPEVTFSAWNQITLANPVPITGTEPLWVGIFIDGPGSNPIFMDDDGPMAAGKGGLISTDGVNWNQLTAYGIDCNWIIEAYVEPGDPAVRGERRLLNAPVSQNSREIDPRRTARFTAEEAAIPEIEMARTTRALIGYDIFRNGEYLDFTASQFYVDWELPEAIYDYHVEAVYHSQNSTPSNTATAEIIHFAPLQLPFIENWNSLNFSEHYWTRWSNWFIDSELGDPAPAAIFYWSPQQTDYAFDLLSWTLDGTGYNNVTAQFDINLANYDISTVEQMTFQVFDGTAWQTIDTFNNQAGDIDWTTEFYDITAHASDREFRVRFVAHGQDTFSIDWWIIDNITIEGTVAALDEPVVTIVIEEGLIELDWAVIDGAASYLIYSSDDPYAQFPEEWTLVTQIAEIGYSEAVDGIKFYRVVATTAPLPVRNVPASTPPPLQRRATR